MAVLFQTDTFVELEFESDLSLTFGGTPVIHTQDTDKYWKVMRGTYVETTVNSIPYIQNLTDAQLRATPVPVSGTVTTSGLTDAQLRASAVPVSLATAPTTPVTGTFFQATQPVSLAAPVSTKTDLTPSAPTTVSVGVASAQAVAAAATRKGLILRNLSTARISLGFGSAAVLDSGVTLYPRDAWQMDEYSFDLGAVNAIASAGTSNLAIQEYL